MCCRKDSRYLFLPSRQANYKSQNGSNEILSEIATTAAVIRNKPEKGCKLQLVQAALQHVTKATFQVCSKSRSKYLYFWGNNRMLKLKNTFKPFKSWGEDTFYFQYTE